LETVPHLTHGPFLQQEQFYTSIPVILVNVAWP